MAIVNLPDPELKRRVEGLAAMPAARELEAKVDAALADYIGYFALHGSLSFSVRVLIEAWQPVAIDWPTTELRQHQMLRALAEVYQRYQQPKKKAEAGETIRSFLAGMLIGGRGH